MTNRLGLSLIFFFFGALLVSAQPVFSTDDPKIGLVLSGGGAKGLAHIGVLKVLEEEQIPVHYITGTSMGSLIGALYAIGYTAQEIETIVISQNWDHLLNDQRPFRNLLLTDKYQDTKYFVTLPIKNWRIGLPVGVVTGHNIQSLLARLTWHSRHIRDFDDFPIPFRCIATNLVTGEAHVMSKGDLVTALRASMSIPAAFTPIERDGQLLTDGGVARNLPVTDVLAMGADIVIGVDVGSFTYQKDELDDLGKILEQSMSILEQSKSTAEREQCRVLIQPDMKGYRSSSFAAASELIMRGEEAARRAIIQLRAIKKSLALQTQFRPQKISRPDDAAVIKKVELIGLGRSSHAMVRGPLGIKPGQEITAEQLDKNIQNIFGTGYFKSVHYVLTPTEDKEEILQLFLNELDQDVFQFGFSYNSEFKSSLLLNLTFLNRLGSGSITKLDGRLSENPAIELGYLYKLGWNPGFGFGLNLRYDQEKTSVYALDGKINGLFVFSDFVGEIYTEMYLWNSIALGLGIAREKALIEPLVGSNFSTHFVNYSDVFAYINVNTLNRSFFPSRGFQLDGYLKLFNDFENSNRVFGQLDAKGQFIIPLPAGFSWKNLFYFSAIGNSPVTEGDLYYLAVSFFSRQRQIPALKFYATEEAIKNHAFFESSVQFKVWETLYFRLSVYDAVASNRLEKISNLEKLAGGYGLSFGWMTPIGPLELNFLKTFYREDYISEIQFGYRF
ncbi:patatin-like phospholipase family protein [bacterium]|nr:patatin-like phospholipase family protein [bacterium]